MLDKRLDVVYTRIMLKLVREQREGSRSGTPYEMKKLAAGLRQDKTDAELALWTRLRSKQVGPKFRQKHPLYGFVVDFWCPKKKLVIEIDPLWEPGALWIANRDGLLSSKGIDTLRFLESEVDADIESVMQQICAHVGVDYTEPESAAVSEPRQIKVIKKNDQV